MFKDSKYSFRLELNELVFFNRAPVQKLCCLSCSGKKKTLNVGRLNAGKHFQVFSPPPASMVITLIVSNDCSRLQPPFFRCNVSTSLSRGADVK